MSTIKKKVRTFSDIDITFSKNPINGDVTIVYDDDAIKASVKNIILTMNYEKPFHPEIGSPVYGLLFEPATPITAEIIRTIIANTLETFEPRAKLNAVDVNAKPDENAYEVLVNFSIANYFEPFEVNVLLQLLR